MKETKKSMEKVIFDFFHTLILNLFKPGVSVEGACQRRCGAERKSEW